MPRTSMRFDPVEIPINVSVSRSKGYVYYNTTTEWVPMKSNPQKKHATHKKVIIGKALIVGENWNTDRRMVPNSNYFLICNYSEPPLEQHEGGAYSAG